MLPKYREIFMILFQKTQNISGMLNVAVTLQRWIVLILLVIDQHDEYNWALWHHSIVLRLFGDKQTSKPHMT